MFSVNYEVSNWRKNAKNSDTERLKRLNCPLTCSRLTCVRKCLFEKGKQMNADDLICRLFSRNSVNQAQAFLGATVLLVDNN